MSNSLVIEHVQNMSSFREFTFRHIRKNWSCIYAVLFNPASGMNWTLFLSRRTLNLKCPWILSVFDILRVFFLIMKLVEEIIVYSFLWTFQGHSETYFTVSIVTMSHLLKTYTYKTSRFRYILPINFNPFFHVLGEHQYHHVLFQCKYTCSFLV